MKMLKYLKEKVKTDNKISTKELLSGVCEFVLQHRKMVVSLSCISFLVLVLSVTLINKSVSLVSLEDMDAINLAENPIAASSSQRSVITIPSGMVKANPFVPYRDLTESGVVNDVPSFNIVEPPETVNEASDAARVMDTIVSGILFDKFSPSAIINIEGNDYLVKKGDVVNNYKIVNITQDSVTVQLGANSYKAGIGEILTEGSLNHNDVSNLKNKFGGEK